MNKKAQLGIIEAKFFIYGLIGGIAIAVALMLLSKYGILPINFSFLCRAATGK